MLKLVHMIDPTKPLELATKAIVNTADIIYCITVNLPTRRDVVNVIFRNDKNMLISNPIECLLGDGNNADAPTPNGLKLTN